MIRAFVGTEGIERRPGLRVALVGPTHPYKGGVAAHTTELAHRLAAAGHDTVLVSWSRLYPRALYPGEQAVPAGGPDLPPFPRTVRSLRWDRPGSWRRTGRRLRDADVVVVVVVVPVQVPALLAVIRALRGRPRIVVLAHNVVPHETHPGGAWLMGRALSAADAVLVHSTRMAEQAFAHGARRVVLADLPPHLPGGRPNPEHGPDRPEVDDTHETDGRDGARPPGLTRVLALGMVRDYKGIDLLLEAAATVPDVAVTVAGEQWGRAGERVRSLATDPRLTGRVHLEAGYVPADRIGPLLATHDVLALPYRHATASQNVLLGHAHGLPVIATDTGTFGRQVRHGIDGLVVPPADVPALAAALRQVARPDCLRDLRRGVPVIDVDLPWQRYLQCLLHDEGLHDEGQLHDPGEERA